MTRYLATLILIANVLIADSQITNPYKGSYKPIYINDTMKCWSVPQSAGMLFLVNERNKFKLELTLADSLYNDEVRKYKKLDSIREAMTYEVHYIDSLYNFELKTNKELDKKNNRLKKGFFVSVGVTILSIIYSFIK